MNLALQVIDWWGCQWANPLLVFKLKRSPKTQTRPELTSLTGLTREEAGDSPVEWLFCLIEMCWGKQ